MSETEIAEIESNERVAAANKSTFSVIRDIVASATKEDMAAVATWLRAMLEVLSVDERGEAMMECSDFPAHRYARCAVDRHQE